MDKQLILKRTLDVFKSVIGESSDINENSSADTIEKWDSLNHIVLIQELEKSFGVKFDLFEIIEIRDVKGIVDYIFSKNYS